MTQQQRISKVKNTLKTLSFFAKDYEDFLKCGESEIKKKLILLRFTRKIFIGFSDFLDEKDLANCLRIVEEAEKNIRGEK